MVKLKKKIQSKKAKASIAENLSQSKIFLIFEAKKIFIELRQTFVKALILNHFDPKRHICIEINIFRNAISKILSQLTMDDLGQ